MYTQTTQNLWWYFLCDILFVNRRYSDYSQHNQTHVKIYFYTYRTLFYTINPCIQTAVFALYLSTDHYYQVLFPSWKWGGQTGLESFACAMGSQSQTSFRANTCGSYLCHFQEEGILPKGSVYIPQMTSGPPVFPRNKRIVPQKYSPYTPARQTALAFPSFFLMLDSKILSPRWAKV